MFSATKTCLQIRQLQAKVSWRKVLLFSKAIPHYSFITWLAVKDMLATDPITRSSSSFFILLFALLCFKYFLTILNLFLIFSTCKYYFLISLINFTCKIKSIIVQKVLIWTWCVVKVSK